MFRGQTDPSRRSTITSRSLIDPAKLEPKTELDEAQSPEVIAALSELSDADRMLAESQRICPVTKLPLGSMGTPPKVDVNGQPIFICCMGCKDRLLNDPQKYLAKLAGGTPAESSQTDTPQTELPELRWPPVGATQLELPQTGIPRSDEDDAKIIAAELAKLSPDDRALAKKQKLCPVTEMPLGSMGTPIKVDEASFVQCSSRTPDRFPGVNPGLSMGSSARTALFDFDPFMTVAIAGLRMYSVVSVPSTYPVLPPIWSLSLCHVVTQPRSRDTGLSRPGIVFPNCDRLHV